MLDRARLRAASVKDILGARAGGPALLKKTGVIHRFAARHVFGMVFGEQVLAVESLAALRARMAQTFPAEDTPLQIPAEVERLLGAKDRPVRA